MKFNHNFSSRFRILSKGRVVLAISVLTSNLLHAAPEQNALPTNPVIVSGNIGISSSAPNNLTVDQSTNKGIINWGTFDIGSNANVRFNQPNVNSSTLNRVVGSNLSQIAGTLSANGQVILINPNGVIFSKGSRVDVGGIVASTLDLSDENYLNNNYDFTRNSSSGKVLNYGEITAQDKGFVALLAPEVINEGVVIARSGSVAFAAGDKVSLDFGGYGLLQVEVDPSTIDSLIENKNLVIADSGIVYMSTKAASDLQSSVISNAGTIQANSIQEVGGKIILTGDDITLTSTSVIEAIGAKGGGEVLVGGDWQGSNDVYQATTVTMESGATIDASATQNGDGGKVVLWSDITNADSVTTANGTILAKAGVQSGDGGNIETSGYQVDIDGVQINAGAPAGNAGEWLLDPYGYTIGSTQASRISTALKTTSVTVDTTNNIADYGSNGNNGSNGDIELTGKIDPGIMSNETTLTLKAHYIIQLFNNSSIDATGSGHPLNVVLWADREANGYGSVKLAGNSMIKSNGGDVVIGGGSSATWNGLTIPGSYARGNAHLGEGILIESGASIDAAGGSIRLWGATNSSTYGRGIDQQGTVKTSGSGNIFYNGDSSTSSDASGWGVRLWNGAVVESGSGAISITGSGSSSQNLYGLVITGSSQVRSSSGAITLSGNTGISIEAGSKVGKGSLSSSSSNITLIADNLALSGTVQSSGHLTLQPDTTGRWIEVKSDASDDLRILPSWFGGTVLPNGFASITLGSAASGDLFMLSPLSVSSPLILDGEGVHIGNNLTTTNDNLTINTHSGGISYLSSGATINLGSGSLINEGSGLFQLMGTLSYSGATEINAGTLELRNDDRLPDMTAVSVASGATLDLIYLVSYSDTIGSIAGAGNIKLGSGSTLTVGGNNSSTTFSGVISSPYVTDSTLVKKGSGTLTLSGDNSAYLSDITVDAGTLVASHASALGTSAKGTTVASGATLDVRANIGAEPVTLNGATLSAPTGSVSMTGLVTLGANSTLSVGGTQLTLSGLIGDGSGTYGFTKTGNGKLLLSGSNTYGGATTIDAGSLQLGASNVIPDTSAVTLASGTNFYLNNYSETIGSLAEAGNISLGSATLTTSIGGTTYSGVISGTGSLVKNNGGTFTLSGNNTYTGTTTVNGGTLEIGAGGASGTLGTGNVAINNYSSLQFNRTGSLSVSNNISGVGNLVKKGSSTLTLSGNNSFTKSTYVQAGQMIVTSNTGLGSTAGSTSISNGASLDLKDVNIGSESINIASGATLKTSSGTSSTSGGISAGTIEVASGAQLTLSGKFEDDNTNDSLVKNGTGTLIITNSTNNYGATVINAGTLQVGTGGTTGKLGRLGITNNATLYINRSDSPSLSSIVSSTSGITGTGSVTAHIGGSLNVDRTITLSGGSSSKIILTAGYNTAAGTESGGDVTLTNTITTSNSGTVTIFSGNANTSTLNSKISGATGTTKYKTYNTNKSTISGARTGTRNFYYRADPKLSISGLTASKTYDGNTNAATSLSGGTVAGNIDGDSTYSLANLTRSSATYSSKDAGSRTLNASYTAPARTANNYNVSGYSVNAYSQANAGTISKKTVTLSGAKTYDGNTALTIGEVAIATGISGETLSFSGASVNDIHVTTANKYIDAITLVNGSGLASNYQVPTLNATNAAVTISAKTLTPTLSNTDVTKVYDGTTDTNLTPTYTYSGFVTGDSDAALSNTAMVYNSSHVSTANTITVSGLTIDSITSTIGSLGSDYVLNSTSKNVNAVITPATLTTAISNTGVTKVYDGSTSAPSVFTPTYNITGFVSGDTASTITNTGSVYDDAHVLTASKITVSGLAVGTITGDKGSQASDYILDATSKDVTAAITPKDLTPRISSVISKVYDGTTDGIATLEYVYTPQQIGDETFTGRLIDGDTNAVLTNTSYVHNSKDVDTANQVTVSGLQIASIAGANNSLSSDYSLTTTTVETIATIEKKEVALGANKVYDGTTNLTGPAVTILTNVGTETLSYSGATVNNSHVSTANKYINNITLLDGGNGGVKSNYKLPTLNNIFAPVDITPASLTAILNNSGVTKIYDGTTSTGITPTYTITGFVSGDNDATISNVSQSYDDAHVLTASKVSVYGMDITGITGNNSSETTDYVLSSNSSEKTATITKATLTPTISNTGVTKIYDGTTNSDITPTYTYGGLVSGDTDAILINTSKLYNDKDVLDANKITVSGLSMTSIIGNRNSLISDYVLDNTSKDVSATITKKTVTLAASKIYDSSTLLNGPAVTILTNVANETLAYSGATTNDVNVLTINKYIDAITLLNGENGGVVSNYKLPTLNSIFAPVTITPASLIISANSDHKAYDAIPYFGGKGVIYNGFVGSETPSILNGSLAYKGNSQSAVNSGVYDITPYGLSNSNYVITFVNGALSIDPQKVIPIPTVPVPVPPPTTRPASTDVSTPAPASNPIPTAPANTNNADINIQETASNSTVSFDGLVVGRTQAGDEVKAIIIQGAASSKVPFTLLVNVKAEEAFSFDIPSDIINQVSKTQIDVTLSDGSKLPSWLNFDENSMSFNSQNVPAGSFPLSVNLKMGAGINAKTIEVIIK